MSSKFPIDDDRFEAKNTGVIFGLAGMLAIVAMIAVVAALFVIAPGLGILVAIFALPPTIRTILLFQKRRRDFPDESISFDKKMTLFMVSAGVTWIVVAAMSAGSLLIFFATLMAICTAAGTQSRVLALSFGGIVAITGLIILFVPIRIWIRDRWRADTTRKNL